jgi:signal transduction histidine kinase
MSDPHPQQGTAAAPAPPPGLRLMRYFTIATLVAFAAVAAVLWALQSGEERFFADVQQQQARFFAQAQAALARQHEEAARASLLAVHEASHVNLTRLVANMLWASDFAPLVARAQRLSLAECQAIEPTAAAAYGVPPTSAPNPRRQCFAEVGGRIRALPGFRELDAKAYAAMQSSTVFKIKVFDLRGLTVYSSEHAQVGEDGSRNQGWQSAAAGKPASELTHRDRFSAFEGVVENRDLISTYVPVRAAGGDTVLGVVELYSDVTPFLVQIKQASQRFASITAANEASVAAQAREDQHKVETSSDRFLLIVIGLLAALYGVSLLIVRNGQRLIDRQTRAQEEAARREALWHREKMAALATMAANVSHEVGNPLAIIAGIAQELPPPAEAGPESPARRILAQTARVGAMMRRISDFATARSEQPECVDVNAMLQALCDFHAFDRRFRGTPLAFSPGAALPACELVPDHLNEVMMGVLLAMLDARPAAAPRQPLQVRTEAADGGVRIGVGLEAGPASAAGLDAALAVDPRLDAVRRRVAQMRGRLEVADGQVRIELPAAAPGG